MAEIETVESMVELRNKLGVLPTLMEVRLSPVADHRALRRRSRQSP
jgi:hypothetical protein